MFHSRFLSPLSRGDFIQQAAQICAILLHSPLPHSVFPTFQIQYLQRRLVQEIGQDLILEDMHFQLSKLCCHFSFSFLYVFSLILEEGGDLQSHFIGTFLHHTDDKLLRSHLVYKNEIQGPSPSSMRPGLAPAAVSGQGPAVGKTKQIPYTFQAWSKERDNDLVDCWFSGCY